MILIVSFQSLQFIKSFRVLELGALFSDGHSLISTSLCFKNDLKVKKSVPINTKALNPRLPEEKRTNFIENLNCIKIQSLLANITQTSQTTDSLIKEKVNALCNKFSEIFNESANSCNNYNNGSSTANNNKKPWFEHQCAKSRKKYHRAKKMHAKHPSTASKASVVSASKMYKKKLNYFICKHKKDTQNKLRRLKSKSPKQFWKILNILQSKKENKDISINDLYFFSRTSIVPIIVMILKVKS